MNPGNISLWAWRFVIALLIQVLIMKSLRIPGDSNHYFQFFFFPVSIFFLPANTQRWLVILLSFAFGLLVDLFYDTPGVFVGSLLIAGYLRPFALSVLEPSSGVKLGKEGASYRVGFSLMVLYSSLLMLIFCFSYFILEIFTFYYIGEILIKSILSFFASSLVVIAFLFIFNPKL
jgi:hypothetical protein